MNSKQVTWRRLSPWKSKGAVKGRNFKVVLIERAPENWLLCVLNREFPYGSEADAKSFCETPGFVSLCDTLVAQWNRTQPSAPTLPGVGRVCESGAAPVVTMI